MMDERLTTQAREIFEEFCVQVVHCSRLLGEVFSDEDGRSNFVTDLVKKWLYIFESLLPSLWYYFKQVLRLFLLKTG